MRILIQNGRVLDPATKTDCILDLLIEDTRILSISEHIDPEDVHPDHIINATGCYVMPGLIDPHVHLRDPGFTYKETLRTGAMAAARGGFTTIVAMANTNPVIDSVERWQEVQHRAAAESPIRILQTATLTKGMLGKELSPILELKKAGVCALSEDGKSVMNAQLFREAMCQAAACNLPVLDHCEDIHMKGKGVVNQGARAKALGLTGITNAVEDVIIARDILIAKETGARLHICHCSTADSVRMIQLAKKEGISVTGEVCPHHFTLDDQDIPAGDSNYKMAPPLRSATDKNALIQGLKEGTLDVIASDHAPHAPNEKAADISSAAFGIVGLETSVPLTISELVRTGILTPLQMAEKMSYYPAKILQIDGGHLSVGGRADITILDPDISYRIDREQFLSKGRNTPFDGRQVHGAVRATIYQGSVVYETAERHD